MARKLNKYQKEAHFLRGYLQPHKNFKNITKEQEDKDNLEIDYIANRLRVLAKTDNEEVALPMLDVSNSLPDEFWFEDEHGHKVTVIGYIKEWVVVEDIHHEEPYCLPFGYVQTIYDEMVAEGNDC